MILLQTNALWTDYNVLLPKYNNFVFDNGQNLQNRKLRRNDDFFFRYL